MYRLRFNTLSLLAATALCLSLARPAAAQKVTASDIQRLQDQVYDASNDVSRMRGSEDNSSRLQGEIDDLRDEVVYLKVKLRKEGSVSRREYTDLQDRIEDVRSQARVNAPDSASTDYGRRPRPTGTSGNGRTIPAGQEIDARLETELSSETAQVEQRFEATTVADLYRGDEVLIPAGSRL